ncbi:beta strand repeat-containing protein, partial [Luteolibacter soli]
LAGTTILGSSSALAANWTGTVSTDWNNFANWSGATGGSGVVTVAAAPPNIATITANINPIPTSMLIGNTAAGRIDHRAGTASLATDGDITLGRTGGGNGTYNLANTGGAGGTLTGFAQGSGTLTVPRNVLVGGSIAAATGAININTTGTLSIGGQLTLGNLGGTGTVKMDSGTLTVVNEFEIGNGTSGTGTFSMSGGTVTKSGAGTAVSVGGGLTTAGGNGTANLNGGAFTTAGVFRIGHGSGSIGALTVAGTNLTVGGEFWVGNQTGGSGTMTLSSGSVTTNSWALVGRKDDANAGVGATGSVTMTGGTWTKSGDNNFVVGDTGAGTMTMSGGTVIVNPSAVTDRGITWIANRNSCTGTLTISGAADFRSPRIVLGVQANTSGTLTLNGGTVRTSSIAGGSGNSEVTFSGTQIIATGNSDVFMDALVTSNIAAGGLKVDSAGFTVAAPQPLGGAGDVTKSGTGTLKLVGANTYTGNHIVTGGKLLLSVDTAATGNTTVSNNAGFGVVQQAGFGTLDQTNVAFGSAGGSTTFDVDLGDSSGNPSVAPLNVTGTLTLNGPVTINVQDLDLDVGTIPLISYTGAKAGTGSFVQGTLPLGVTGHIQDNGSGLVSLVVEALNYPVWTGAVNGNWDFATQNWQDAVTSAPLAFANNLPVIFAEVDAAEKANVTLNTTVIPGSLRFDAFGNPYTISGTGKISGTTGLVQAGTANLTLNTANDFTGPVQLLGGTTSINTVSNAGSAASLGTGTSPVVLDGGNLNYTGPNATTDRGLSILSPGALLTNANNLTISGPLSGVGGSFAKDGAGNLTLSNAGANVLSTAGNVLVHGGTLTLAGGSHSVTGELWVADQPDVPANMVLNGATLTTSNWVAIGRGNGNAGVVNVTATNSTINSVNFSSGYNNALANNESEAFITLNNSIWNNGGVTYLAESSASQATMILNGTSQYNITGNFLLARLGTSQATFTMNGTSKLTKTGTAYSSIGTEGNAVMNVNDNAIFSATGGDFNVGDVGTSNSALNINGSGSVIATQVYIGKNTNTTGVLNQAGGSFQSGSFISIGSNGGVGTVNLSAGSLTATTVINVAGTGSGTFNISGTATATANGNGVFVGASPGGFGVLNLNGGTLVTKVVAENTGGLSTVNFNGGLLKAAAGATATFVGPIDNAVIQSGGAFIDTNGQTLSVTANLSGTGGLTKSGTGTLTLSGTNTYTGNTTVSAGTLSLGAAFLGNSSTVNIASGAVLNLTHGAVDQVATLILNGVSQPVGTYSSATPGGYITGSGSLQVTGAVASPYDTWMSGFPSIPLADRDPGDDPDGDGSTNAVEFALGSTPNSGTNRPKVYQIIADSSADVDSTKELLLTIAVRSGAPAFTGSPSPTATQDGYTYTIQGSTNLGSFVTAAVPVTTVATGLPAAPAGYEYRTFSLTGSNGNPTRGFMRVGITP